MVFRRELLAGAKLKVEPGGQLALSSARHPDAVVVLRPVEADEAILDCLIKWFFSNCLPSQPTPNIDAASMNHRGPEPHGSGASVFHMRSCTFSGQCRAIELS